MQGVQPVEVVGSHRRTACPGHHPPVELFEPEGQRFDVTTGMPPRRRIRSGSRHWRLPNLWCCAPLAQVVKLVHAVLRLGMRAALCCACLGLLDQLNEERPGSWRGQQVQGIKGKRIEVGF